MPVRHSSIKDFYTIVLQNINNYPNYSILQNYQYSIDILMDISTQSSSRLKIDNEVNSEFQLVTRRVVIPQNLSIDVKTVDTEYGHISYPNNKTLDTQEHTFSIWYLSTENSPHETFFIDWINEVTANRYLYDDKPFMKAEIIINFYTQSDNEIAFMYKFKECYPYSVGLISQISHDINSLVIEREIKFAFNWMQIEGGEAINGAENRKNVEFSNLKKTKTRYNNTSNSMLERGIAFVKQIRGR